jgi:uncharacterized protein
MARPDELASSTAVETIHGMAEDQARSPLAPTARSGQPGAVGDPDSTGVVRASRMPTGALGAAAFAPQGAGSAHTAVPSGAVRLRIHPALRFLVPRRARENGEVDLPHDPSATVGHLIQSVGVPLTEVGDVFVSGVLVSVHSRPQDQDRLDVAVRARPQPLEGPAQFLLDVHLGTLARRLRLLGVDTAYERYADDNHLVERAGLQDRVLLSRDRGLLMRRSLRRSAFVRGQDPDDQLADVIGRFRPPLRPWSLCLACGGSLMPVSKALVTNQLEPGTVRTKQQFFRCQACRQVYWHGAHDLRLQQVVRRYK